MNIASQKIDPTCKNIATVSCYRSFRRSYKHIFDDFNADPATIGKEFKISQKYISNAVGKMVYWPPDGSQL